MFSFFSDTSSDSSSADLVTVGVISGGSHLSTMKTLLRHFGRTLPMTSSCPVYCWPVSTRLMPAWNMYSSTPGSAWPDPPEMSPTFQPVRPSVVNRLIFGASARWPAPGACPAGIAAPAAAAPEAWKNVLRVILVIACPVLVRA